MIAEIIGKKVSLKNPNLFCGDTNVDTITFVVPKMYKNISLVDVPAYIKTKNGLGECYKKNLSVTDADDKLQVEWHLGREVTAVGGNIDCQLSFEKNDGSLVFNTQIFGIFVGDSVPDDILASETENYITQLQNMLLNKLDLVEVKYQDATRTFVFANVGELSSAIGLDQEFKAGDILRICDNACPDLYVNRKENTAQPFVFTDLSAFLNQMSTNGEVQMGKYVIKAVSGNDNKIGLPSTTASDVGKIVRVNASGLWEIAALPLYGGNNSNLVAFTINELTYYAQAGMSWAAWCGSGYNTDGFVIHSVENYISHAGLGRLRLKGENTDVLPSSVIIDKCECVTSNNANGGGVIA